MEWFVRLFVGEKCLRSVYSEVCKGITLVSDFSDDGKQLKYISNSEHLQVQ